jgi:tetraacyldisaccharide 4'-kinase
VKRGRQGCGAPIVAMGEGLYYDKKMTVPESDTRFTLPPWERSGWVSGILIPFGWLYGLGMEVRNWLYDRGIFKVRKLPVPVVVVGNLTVGGTGKTPLTIELVSELLRRNTGLKVGILSRGYKRSPSGKWVVSDGKDLLMGVEEAGDEPYLMARRLPGVKVFVGADRVSTARKAVARYDLDLLVLDDAFQHRRLHRDADVLVIDAEKGFYNGRVLPAGPLREFAGNVRRATCCVFTRYSEENRRRSESLIPVAKPIFGARMTVAGIEEAVSGESLSREAIRGQRVWGVCGIARPDAFRKTLEELNLRVLGLTAFPDHHDYSSGDFERILRQGGEDVTLVTTEKDWVKWEGKHPFGKVYVVSVRMNFVNGEELCDFIETIVYNRIKGLQGGKG